MNFFSKLAIVAIAFLLLSAKVYLFLYPKDVVKERVFIKNPSNQTLVGDFYLPRDIQEKLPAVLLCHGVEANKEVMGHLGVELARRGFAVLAFDYGGYGESDKHSDELELMIADTVSALKYLLLRRETLGEGAIAMVGHSMGVTYSTAVAEKAPFVAGVVGLGNEAIFPSVPPRNMMLAMGIYDAFHTLKDMLDAVRISAGVNEIQANEIKGDFKAGTARMLVTSPFSDHGIEPLDPLLMRKTISWVEKCLDINCTRDVPVVETYRAQARIVAFFSAFLLIMSVMVILRKKYSAPNLSLLIVKRSHFLPIFIGVVGGNLISSRCGLLFTDVILCSLLAGSVANALAYGENNRTGNEIIKVARTRFFGGALFVLLIAGCLLTALLVNGLPSAIRLGYVDEVPLFLFYILTLRPYEGLCMTRAYLFVRYSNAVVPNIPTLLILSGEFIKPGLVTLILAKIANTLVKAFQLKGPIKLQTSKGASVTAVVAFSVLAFVLYRRFQEGWLSEEATRRMFWISLKFMILPLVLFIVVVNIWSIRKANESKKMLNNQGEHFFKKGFPT